jgi:glyoxylase-like metal-dependent hydrolase (beta-lactamase superfamily II)
MNIIKYEHACIDIRVEKSRLIIDPGIFSMSLTDLASIDVLIITHVHPDHLDEQKVRAIIAANPNIKVFSTHEVAIKLSDLIVIVPELEKVYTELGVTLEFFGQLHASILPSIPQVQNFGVLVNSELYYTGDSFTPCPKPHTMLGITVSAPWMKLSEAVDFISQDSATTIFPCHDGFLNDSGRALINGLLRTVVEATHKTYTILGTDETT